MCFTPPQLVVAAILLAASIARAQKQHPDYAEDGSSGPGLYEATRKVKSLSVLNPENPQHVELRSYYATRPPGNLILQNPRSRFAVVLWRDDALGDDVSVLDSGVAELPGPWRKTLQDRFWAGEWSRDVTFLSWSPDGEEMVIQTSDVYNEGGTYWLDLYNRTARQISSIHDGGNVARVDWARRRLLRKKNADPVALPPRGPRGNLRGRNHPEH